MTDFRERYKRVGYGREDADMNRALRSQRRDEARREARSQHRDINMLELQDDTFEREEEEERQREQQQREHEAAESQSETELDVGVQKRLLQLEKWREERNRKKLQEKKKAKPVFKVGVVHHKVYSPPLNKEPVPLPPAKLCKSREVPLQSPPPKRVTRATEKRLAVKAITDQQKRAVIKKKRENQLVKQQRADNDGNHQSLAPLDHQFKAPSGIMAIPMFGRHGLGANENVLPTVMPNEIFSDTASTSSFASRSFIHSKSSNLSSNLKESSIHSRDSLNSSGEAFVLRMSSDGHEMLDGNDRNSSTNVQSLHSQQSGRNRKKSSVATQNKDISIVGTGSPSKSLDSASNRNAVNHITGKSLSNHSSSSSRKSQTQSSRKFSPPQEVTSATNVDHLCVPEEHEVSTLDNQSKSKKSLPSGTRTKRCTRQVSNKSSLSDDISSTNQQSSVESNQDASRESEENQTQQMDVDGVNTNSSANNKKVLDSSKRKSLKELDTEGDLRRLSNCVVQVDKNKVEFELSKSHKTIISPDEADLKVSENGKEKLLHRRKSIRNTAEANNANEVVESPDTTDVRQASQVPTRVVYNLMDYTLSDLNGLTNRKSTRTTTCFSKAPENIVEQSLIKFSPRHSTIVQSVQANDDKLAVSSSTYLSLKTSMDVDNSLVKFSPLLERTSTRLETLAVPDSAKKLSDGGNSSIDSSLDDRPPAFFSPFIVTSRGKTSARKETKRRRFSQASPEDIPTKDTVMLNSTVSPEEEERTAQYYKYLLDKEIERLNECCDHWNSIKQDNTLPEDIYYMIHAAVGQTQLLVNKKFKRFRGLVLDCETGRGEMLVTCKDLQGFWEMMYMEVKNCDGRFEELNKLKSNNWVEGEPENQPKPQPKKIVKKPVAKKKAVTNKPSSLRAHIMAARKKKMENQDNEDAVTPIIEEKGTESQMDCEREKVVTESLTKSRRTSTPKSTAKWQDLMNKMQKSQSRKTTSSPLVVMKLSQMCKTPEVHMDESIVYINSNRTPAKSILKTSKDETLGSVTRSTNKVIFREQAIELREFDPESRLNNDADYDTEDTDQEKEPIERRLNFESDSFNCSADELGDERETLPMFSNHADSPFPSSSSLNRNRKSIPNIVVDAESPLISMSPLSLTDTKVSSSMKKPGSAKKRKQITFKEDSEKSSRSGKFSAPLTPIPRSTRIPLADEDTEMDVDDDRIGENRHLSSTSIPEQKGVEEIYLNEHGIVSTRIVPVKKNTPASIKLKRSNSERLQQYTKSFTKMEGADVLATPKSRKRNGIPEIILSRPDTPVVGNAHESEATPTIERNAKRSYADITLTEENVGEVRTPKVRRKIPKISHSPLCDIDQDEDVQKSVKSVRRSKSLNLKPSDIPEITKEPTTPRSNNTTIHLDVSSIRDKYVRKTPRSNAVKNSKKLQENLDPNEHDLSLNEDENMKLSTTPSLKRSSKKLQEYINSDDQQTDGHEATKDPLTPNGRRKSLRIAQTSSGRGN